MSTITTLPSAINASKSVIDTNFSNLNTDKLESTDLKTVNWNSLVWSGDIVISGGGSVATDTIWDAKWDLAGWTGANTASRLAVGSNWQVLTADSAEATGLKWTNPAGWWDALTSGTLAQFASTTSAQLATVISDETGSGSLVFANSPALVTPVLGTPTSGTLTNCTGLPIAWLVASTSTALGVGSVELWHASDTTISRVSAGVIAVEGVTVPTISSTSTITNKRIPKRVVVVTQSATPAINTDNGDIFQITGLAQAITSLTTNLTGSPLAGDMFELQITDNGTARAITPGASFANTTITHPTTTAISTMVRILYQRNNANTVWDIIATC